MRRCIDLASRVARVKRFADTQMPGVTAGLVADWRKWSDIQAANVSFGQGMTATPLQLASALSAIANGGTITHHHESNAFV